MSIPEGYKLVPVEPTEEMQDFGASYMPVDWASPHDAAVVFKQMLAASPAPPQPIYDEAKEKEAHMEWFQNSEKFVNEYDQSLYGWLACAQSRAKAGEVGHE